MRPTRSPRMIVVREVAHDRRARRARSSRRAPRRPACPDRSASCACSLHRAGPLAPRTALDAHRLERAHAAFVARAPRLDARADPDLLLRELPVELRPLLRLGGERRLLALEVGVVVARPNRRAGRDRAPRCASRRRRRNARSCVTKSSVVPRSMRNSSIHSIASMSRWLVGSSSSSTSGCRTSARASNVWRFRPPDASANSRVGIEPEMREHRVDARLHLPRIRRVERVMQAVELAQRGSLALDRRRGGSRRDIARAAPRARRARPRRRRTSCPSTSSGTSCSSRVDGRRRSAARSRRYRARSSRRAAS